MTARACCQAQSPRLVQRYCHMIRAAWHYDIVSHSSPVSNFAWVNLRAFWAYQRTISAMARHPTFSCLTTNMLHAVSRTSERGCPRPKCLVKRRACPSPSPPLSRGTRANCRPGTRRGPFLIFDMDGH
ncbi:hypothetical protein VFPFJ_04561 [Purpureocillium lilacinum]|uniref:Uncharacterized protein n=1 Tax=Purpureocillium lilacinum TaxID=33203 RepID=A0A179HLH1_PURLI|nr:hypothetical protein VFPFJ_04561 [Purpureocillium lilacinum]OAQ90401.1 hypothetical protein VFPFJ_04561 [Purpureocillium lilacinum]